MIQKNNIDYFIWHRPSNSTKTVIASAEGYFPRLWVDGSNGASYMIIAKILKKSEEEKKKHLTFQLLVYSYTNYKGDIMSDRTYGAQEKAKLERLVNEGVTVLQEVEDLQQGLKETVKAVAEELDIKPGPINKAIKIAQKGDWDRVNDEFEDLETLVVTVGKDK